MNAAAEAAAERRAMAWTWAREMPEFTPYELRDRIGMGERAAWTLCRDWEAKGLATRERRGSRGRSVFSVKTVHRGAETVELALTPARDKATPFGNMWRAMRGLRTFSAIDIALHSTVGRVAVSPADASNYCEMLEGAGYIRRDGQASRGRSETVYRILRNTGIHAPVQRQVLAVWDENLGEFTHAPGILA
ncbi:MAG: hypothetical protein QNJ16_15895 [Rhodobacter sp.]|nr:hypothetical protein [Rhodobacter sp.]